MDVVDFSKHHPLQNTSVDDIVEYIRELEEKGLIHRMIVVIEDDGDKSYIKSMNYRNKDYAFFLAKEMSSLFSGGEDNGA